MEPRGFEPLTSSMPLMVSAQVLYHFRCATQLLSVPLNQTEFRTGFCGCRAVEHGPGRGGIATRSSGGPILRQAVAEFEASDYPPIFARLVRGIQNPCMPLSPGWTVLAGTPRVSRRTSRNPLIKAAVEVTRSFQGSTSVERDVPRGS